MKQTPIATRILAALPLNDVYVVVVYVSSLAVLSP